MLRTELETYFGDTPVLEMVYPVASPDAYKTVCAAVFYALSRMNPMKKVQWHEGPTATQYMVFTNHICAQVFVLHATDNVVDVRIHYIGTEKPYKPEDCGDLLKNDVFIRAASHLLQVIDDAIVGLLRVGMCTDDLKPPVPPCTNMRAVFNWQRMYYPSMTDGELAQRIGMEAQSVRNERSKHNFSKRTFSEALPIDELRRRYPLERIAQQKVPRGRKKR